MGKMKYFARVEHWDGEQMFCHNFVDGGNAFAYMLGVVESYRRDGHKMQMNNKYFYVSLNSDVMVRYSKEVFMDSKKVKKVPRKTATTKTESENVTYVDFKSGMKFANYESWIEWKRLA